MSQTTADLRNLAIAAERELRWKDASKLWSQAIQAYPVSGGLAMHDIAKMTKRAVSCAATAREEAREAMEGEFNSASSHHHY